MHFILFALASMLIGFVAAIPVSASQLEVARRAINGYFGSALMLILGGSTSDIIYGLVAFFGVRSFLRHPVIESIFWIANAAILIGIGIYTIRHTDRPIYEDKKAGRALGSKRIALVTGFTLSIMNPLMISWWLIGANLLEDAGLMERAQSSSELTFLAFAATGLASYSVLVAFVVSRVKRLLSQHTISRITFWFGIALFALAGYFIVRSTMTLLHPRQQHKYSSTQQDIWASSKVVNVPGAGGSFE